MNVTNNMPVHSVNFKLFYIKQDILFKTLVKTADT